VETRTIGDVVLLRYALSERFLHEPSPAVVRVEAPGLPAGLLERS
jgi:hypothetical protein